MMQNKRSDHQAGVADPIREEYANRTSRGFRSLLEKRNQQRGGDANQFPSADQQIDGSGGEHQQRAERKQVQQHEEAMKTGLAMQIPLGKDSHESYQSDRQRD